MEDIVNFKLEKFDSKKFKLLLNTKQDIYGLQINWHFNNIQNNINSLLKSPFPIKGPKGINWFSPNKFKFTDSIRDNNNWIDLIEINLNEDKIEEFYNNLKILSFNSNGKILKNSFKKFTRQQLSFNEIILLITEIKPIRTVNNKSPVYKFQCNKDCFISNSTIPNLNGNFIKGLNQITFENLNDGIYEGQKINFVDIVDNSNSFELQITRFVIDTVNPILKELDSGIIITNNNKPKYYFSSTEEGTLSSDLKITSSNKVVIGRNEIQFSKLNDGTYENNKIIVTDLAGNSSDLIISSFTIDTLIPEILVKSNVEINKNKMEGTFKISTNKTLINLTSSLENVYVFDNLLESEINFITNVNNEISIKFKIDSLKDGIYDKETISFTDIHGDKVEVNIPEFIIDNTKPILKEKVNIKETFDNSPKYIFESNEEGGFFCDIPYFGIENVKKGENIFFFKELPPGEYNPIIKVTDSFGNVGELIVTSFKIKKDTKETIGGIMGDPHILTFGGNRCELPHSINSYELLNNKNIKIYFNTTIVKDEVLVDNVLIKYNNEELIISLFTLEISKSQNNDNFLIFDLGEFSKKIKTNDNKYKIIFSSEKNGILVKSSEYLTQENSSGILMSDSFDECTVSKIF